MLRERYFGPATLRALPLALSNHSVLRGGASLPYVAHPWLPRAILGYASSSGNGGSQ